MYFQIKCGQFGLVIHEADPVQLTVSQFIQSNVLFLNLLQMSVFLHDRSPIDCANIYDNIDPYKPI